MSMVYLDALSLDCCTDPDSLTIISSFPLSSLLGNRHQRSVVDLKSEGLKSELKWLMLLTVTAPGVGTRK